MLSHWQRVLAYFSWCLVIGLALVVFTHNIFRYANEPGATGYITLMAFGIALLNLSLIINRRFVLKSDHNKLLNYLFSFVTIAPTLLWIFTKDTGLGDARLAFTLTIMLASFVGTYWGIHRGLMKREQYWENQNYYEEEELPDDLKRPHDQLNKN